MGGRDEGGRELTPEEIGDLFDKAQDALAGIEEAHAAGDFRPIRGDVSDTSPIDLSFRPDTYWPPELTDVLKVARIVGEQRRRRAEAALYEGEFDPSDPMFAPRLQADDLEMWGRIHPLNLGGEYLPDLLEDEVEIARVAITSTTGDVYSIRARSDLGGIQYRVVDEYDNEFSTGVRVFDQPLTLRELIDFIDASDIDGDDGPGGGLVLGIVRAWYGYDPDRPERLLTAAWASSAFYPDLGRYYERAVRSLVSELTASSPRGGG